MIIFLRALVANSYKQVFRRDERDIAFVSDWLKQNGLQKLCISSICEGM